MDVSIGFIFEGEDKDCRGGNDAAEGFRKPAQEQDQIG